MPKKHGTPFKRLAKKVERLLLWLGRKRSFAALCRFLGLGCSLREASHGRDGCPVALMIGFTSWKHGVVSKFLKEYRPLFLRTILPPEACASKILESRPERAIVWGYNESRNMADFLEKHGIPVSRMEDGFLRSARLGAAHTPPYSLVLDESGLYYDAERPSDLERILSEHDFESYPGLLDEARKLMAFQKELSIGKYNIPAARQKFMPRTKKRKVLVIGQVENDKSVLKGRADGWNCRKLVELACDENPDCEVLYKPHPDVFFGYRDANDPIELLPPQCTAVRGDVPLPELFAIVDKVYVMTSLSGFEALIHRKEVITAGMPFYAGWGLTRDRVPQSRRRRYLSLAELYAGTCLLYPRYLLALDDPVAGCRRTLLRLCEERDHVRLAGSNWFDSCLPKAVVLPGEPVTPDRLATIFPGLRLAFLEKDGDLGVACRGLGAKYVIHDERLAPARIFLSR